MRILITSDTHVRHYSDLPETLRKDTETADAVIHAGDYGSAAFYAEFVAKCARFYGVLGNNDALSLPNELVLELDGVRIAVSHSDNAFGNRIEYLTRKFRKSAPDIIVYGHTHKNELYDQLKPVILNPGSPTRARGGFNSYAVLETGGGDFTIDIIKLKGVFL